MFDDLRSRGSAFDDDETPEQEIEAAPAKKKSSRRKSAGPSEIPILGMTALQRLVISIMLFLDISVLGFFLLLAAERVVIPGF
ncbi:MAG TPA: hypothetical protein VI547_10895 [Anaerolineales bacterium]|nr:hypothetical protein [Anaerolineales bacterium]HLF02473.1 hypothetical protein [Anaerolineales bacterium]